MPSVKWVNADWGQVANSANCQFSRALQMPIWAYSPFPFALYAVAVQCQLMCATSGRWENVGEERMSSILLKFFRVNPGIGSCGRWDFIYMSLLDVQVGQLPIRAPKSCSWTFCTFCFGTPTLWRLYPSWKSTRYIHTNEWFSAYPCLLCDLCFKFCGMVICGNVWLE